MVSHEACVPFIDVGAIRFASLESGAKGSHVLGKLCVSHAHFRPNAKLELQIKSEPFVKEACPPY